MSGDHLDQSKNHAARVLASQQTLASGEIRVRYRLGQLPTVAFDGEKYNLSGRAYGFGLHPRPGPPLPQWR
jgi:hypothetical protein